MQQPYDYGNPYKVQLLKYAQQLFGNKYNAYHEILSRMVNVIAIQKDATDFGKMLVDLYQVGYMKAVEDYRDAIEKHGLKIELKKTTEQT